MPRARKPSAKPGNPVGEPAEVIAKVIKLTARRVRQLAEDGTLPRVSRGRYLLIPCVHAYIDYLQARLDSRQGTADDGSLDAARTRKTAAEAQLAEIALAAAQARVVAIERYEAEFSERCDALAARVRGLGQYTGDIQVVSTYDEAADLVERMISEQLAALRGTVDDDGLEVVPDGGRAPAA